MKRSRAHSLRYLIDESQDSSVLSGLRSVPQFGSPQASERSSQNESEMVDSTGALNPSTKRSLLRYSTPQYKQSRFSLNPKYDLGKKLIKKQTDEDQFRVSALIRKRRESVYVSTFRRVMSQKRFIYEEEQSFFDQSDRSRLFCKIIQRNGRVRIVWDLFIILISVLHFIGISLKLSLLPQVFDTTFFFTAELIMTGSYILDIFFNFNTSYFDREKQEVKVRSKIALRYIKTTFALDLIVLIPFHLLNIEELSFVSVLKLLRLFRVKRFIERLNINLKCKLYIKLIYLIFILIFAYHFIATIWITVESEARVSPLFWIDKTLDDLPKTKLFIYLESFYYSLMAGISQDEVGPTSGTQNAVACLVMLIGALLEAVTFSLMSLLVNLISVKNKAIYDKIDAINDNLSFFEIPKEIKKNVRFYIHSSQHTKQQQEEITQFLSYISPSLRSSSLTFLFARVIRNNEIFRNGIAHVDSFFWRANDEKQRIRDLGIETLVRKKTGVIFNISTRALELISMQMEPCIAIPEQTILDYDQKNDSIYFIQTGGVDVFQKKIMNRGEKFKKNLKSNQHFGEISMHFNSPQWEKVRSNKYSIFGKIREEGINRIRFTFPGFFKALKEDLKTYSNPQIKQIQYILDKIPFFKTLNSYRKLKLACKCKMYQFEPGSFLYKRGDIPRGLWIILRGYVVLKFNSCHLEVPMAVLKRGTILNYDRMAWQKEPQVMSAETAQFSTCAYLSFSLIKEIALKDYNLQKGLEELTNAIQNNNIRPYPMDYYYVKTSKKRRESCIEEKPKIMEVIEEEKELETQQDCAESRPLPPQLKIEDVYIRKTARDAKFKVKNAIIRRILAYRISENKRSMFFRIKCLIEEKVKSEKEKALEVPDSLQQKVSEDSIQLSEDDEESSNQESPASLQNFIALSSKISRTSKQALEKLQERGNRIQRCGRQIIRLEKGLKDPDELDSQQTESENSLISRVEPLIMSFESIQLETQSSGSVKWAREMMSEIEQMQRSKVNLRYGGNLEPPLEKSRFKKMRDQ